MCWKKNKQTARHTEIFKTQLLSLKLLMNANITLLLIDHNTVQQSSPETQFCLSVARSTQPYSLNQLANHYTELPNNDQLDYFIKLTKITTPQ